ncbi:MAG: amidohydrolase, partial [Oribacterium sp.]|nr:amidohydrolase [Oribacterium sp.]
MENNKKNAVEYIDKTKKIYTDVSDKIWADPELSLKEWHAAALYEQVLKDHGFTVETGLAGIETAFSG